MVKGRLPRESNPVPGQSQPGFVPAFDETGNEDYVRVSNKKPYPVANYTQNPSGVWLPTSQNNPMPTQLTGSNVPYGESEIEVTIQAGASANVYRNLKMQTPKYLVYVRTETAHDFDINNIWETSDGESLGASVMEAESVQTFRSGINEIGSYFLRVQMVNKDVMARTYRAFVLGVM